MSCSPNDSPFQGPIQKTNYSDKQRKHQQQQQSGIPSSSDNKTGDSGRPGSLSSHQHPQQKKPQVTVANDLSNRQNPTQSHELVAPIQAPPQQNLPKDNHRSTSKITSNTGKEQTSDHNSVKAKNDFPEDINPTLSGEGHLSPIQNQVKEQPVRRETRQEVKKQNPVLVPAGQPQSQPPMEPPPIVRPSSPVKKQPVRREIKQEVDQQSISDSLGQRRPSPMPDGQPKSRPPTDLEPPIVPHSSPAKQQPDPRETRQEDGQQSISHPLPVPEGYPPKRPPTAPSKLEPPTQPPRRCSCCSIL